MDTLRGTHGIRDDNDAPGATSDPFDNRSGHAQEADLPPPAIGTDERRMQVRAYNFWASMLADRNFPDIASFDPAARDDFSPYSVLLDFSDDPDDPQIAFLGEKLALECDCGTATINRLYDVPSRSLLSRITDHYMQIIANQAPIGFEAEFVNQRGATILYRGILLPFSSDDQTIDYIYGVINWKELADQQTADELLLEIDQALDTSAPARRRLDPVPIADWADGPGALLPVAEEDADFLELTLEHAQADPAPLSILCHALPDDAPHHEPASMGLADWLAAAREQAAAASEREDRSRSALYEAVGRAWDFAIAAAKAPDEFAELLEDAGLTVQERAPMTPVVKLVFGADYDKTRLTEYAAALTHARRIGLGRGMLAGYLLGAEGGLKGVVAAERRFRRAEAGLPPRPTRDQPRPAIARRLRTLAPRGLDSIAPKGGEFTLVMVRRTLTGDVQVLGEVPGDGGLIEKAARQLLG